MRLGFSGFSFLRGIRLQACLRVWAIGAALILNACASLPSNVVRHPSSALNDSTQTSFGRITARLAPQPGASGFRLISSGEDAYATLLQLIDHAERTLDLQYYKIDNDAPTRHLLSRIYTAAERGVRVRLLVDDMNTVGQDGALARFGQHPNIEVRLFNPFVGGRSGRLTRFLAAAFDLQRVSRRMHNKLCVADNALASTGGRNLGAAYFLQDPESNFLDLDLLVAGPTVHTLSAAFDRYWNSDLAYPIDAVIGETQSHIDAGASSGAKQERSQAAQSAALPATLSSVKTRSASMNDASNIDQDSSSQEISPSLFSGPPIDPVAAEATSGNTVLRDMVWLNARVLVDRPDKASFNDDNEVSSSLPNSETNAISTKPSTTTPIMTSTAASAVAENNTVVDDLLDVLHSAREEVLIVAPYFVPGKKGMDVLHELQQRGVKLRILTNSLAATDAWIVYTGYEPYRLALIKQGVDVYELRSNLEKKEMRLGKFGNFGKSLAMLHAKTVVVDRKILFLGSMNFDPRSEHLNTEAAIVLRSAVLASEVARLFDETINANAYRVMLNEQGNDVMWVTPGQISAPLTAAPETTFFQRLGVHLLAPLVPEEQL